MIDLNLFLSIVNGAWTIMLSFFILFLLHYLWESRAEIELQDWFLSQPRPTQVAVAILVADLGNWAVRGMVWIWREVGAPQPLPDWLIIGIGAGAFVGTIGMLCKLRVFTMPRFGHAPWIACAAATTAFIIVKMA